MMTLKNTIALSVFVLAVNAAAMAQEFQLLTGVDAGLTPGTARTYFPTGFPATAVPGSFTDGDRLAGTPGTATATYGGTGTPLLSPNQYGSLSFMFRRGSVPIPNVGQAPVEVVDFLGGPNLDLDGDLGNGSRRLTPQTGQTPVDIPGSKSAISLALNKAGGTVGLTNFDATSTNQGFQGFGPNIAVTVNTLAGTQPNTTLGPAINPAFDTRAGALSLHAPNIYQISNLGYEFWQDSIDPTSSTASTLGTFQYLGSMRGWYVERDSSGNFPTLAGQGLGSTLWPLVDAGAVGTTANQSGGAPPIVTISAGPTSDLFTAPGNGGLALTAFGGDLGAYLDNVVVPLIDPASNSFVYLESAGFGMNNSFDPVFGDTVGYDVVLIGQSAPVPEPMTLLPLVGFGLFIRRRAPRRPSNQARST
jgi:hypothetical protein